MGTLFDLILLTDTPKGSLRTDLLRFDDETFCLDNVEKYFTDHVGVTGTGQFQTGPESKM